MRFDVKADVLFFVCNTQKQIGTPLSALRRKRPTDNLATMPGFAKMNGVAVGSDGRADPQSQLFRASAVGVETGPMISQVRRASPSSWRLRWGSCQQKALLENSYYEKAWNSVVLHPKLGAHRIAYSLGIMSRVSVLVGCLSVAATGHPRRLRSSLRWRHWSSASFHFL